MTGFRMHNPNWKGGKYLSSHGYIKILLPGSHLSDSKGYAYEHRIIAERLLGRQLNQKEIIHHLNGNKTDNSFKNIKILENRSYHGAYHPAWNKSNKENPIIFCQCGCGISFLKYDKSWRPRQYITGHNMGKKQNGKV